MKGYLFDTHVHTSESSSCGEIPAAEVAERYKKLGYDGIIITDHMNKRNMSKLGGEYAVQIENFFKGYDNAKALENENFKVILGMELRFLENDNDYLVYGFDKDFLRDNPLSQIESLEAFLPFAKEHDLTIIQAHPFREGMTVTEPELLDGIEVYNGHGGHNSSNDIAFRWAEKYSLRMTSGSDFHRETGMEPGGIIFEEMPKNSFDVARLIKENRYTLKCYTK